MKTISINSNQSPSTASSVIGRIVRQINVKRFNNIATGIGASLGIAGTITNDAALTYIGAAIVIVCIFFINPAIEALDAKQK